MGIILVFNGGAGWLLHKLLMQAGRHGTSSGRAAYERSVAVGARDIDDGGRGVVATCTWGMLQVAHANLLAGLLQSDPWTRDLPLAVDGSEANCELARALLKGAARPEGLWVGLRASRPKGPR